MPVIAGREYREMPLLIPATATQKRINSEHYVEGYATTFDSPYCLYEYEGNKYYEVIERGALDGADMSDIIMQYNHDGKVFARQSNKTLGVVPDEKGLFIFADLSKSNAARDMYDEIKTGLITRMSWAFTVAKDSYDRDTRTRRIMSIKKVYDVSAVSYPANPETEITARSYFNGVIEVEKQELLKRMTALEYISLKIKLGVL